MEFIANDDLRDAMQDPVFSANMNHRSSFSIDAFPTSTDTIGCTLKNGTYLKRLSVNSSRNSSAAASGMNTPHTNQLLDMTTNELDALFASHKPSHNQSTMVNGNLHNAMQDPVFTSSMSNRSSFSIDAFPSSIDTIGCIVKNGVLMQRLSLNNSRNNSAYTSGMTTPNASQPNTGRGKLPSSMALLEMSVIELDKWVINNDVASSSDDDSDDDFEDDDDIASTTQPTELVQSSSYDLPTTNCHHKNGNKLLMLDGSFSMRSMTSSTSTKSMTTTNSCHSKSHMDTGRSSLTIPEMVPVDTWPIVTSS